MIWLFWKKKLNHSASNFNFQLAIFF